MTTSNYKLSKIMKIVYFICLLSDRYLYYRGSFINTKNPEFDSLPSKNLVKINTPIYDIYLRRETLISSPHIMIFLLNDYTTLSEIDSLNVQRQLYFCFIYDLFIFILSLINIFRDNSSIISLFLLMDNSFKIYTIWMVEFSNGIFALEKEKEMKRFFKIFIPGVFSENFKELFEVIIFTLNEMKIFIINIVAIIIMTFIKLLYLFKVDEKEDQKVSVIKKKDKLE